MSLEELVSTYGYAAVAIGTFLEGETVLILGGLSAHRGFLELPWVIMCAFLGSFLGDQTCFYIGRVNGERFLAKRPHLKVKATKVITLLNAHQTSLILGARFMYGLRTVTPFIIGAAKVSPIRYLILDAVGALAWAITVSYLGYTFGYAFEAMIPEVKHYEVLLFSSIAGLGLAVWVVRQFTMRRGSNG
jgi:membrane protein DedA with SNARE-associated domain